MGMRLRNVSRQTLVYNLDHATCCEASCLCERTERVTFEHNTQTGDRGRRTTPVRLARSLMLAPGADSEVLPEAVRKVAAISRGLARGELKEIA